MKGFHNNKLQEREHAARKIPEMISGILENQLFLKGVSLVNNKTWKNITEEDNNFSTCSTKSLYPRSRNVNSKSRQTPRNSWTRNCW